MVDVVGVYDWLSGNHITKLKTFIMENFILESFVIWHLDFGIFRTQSKEFLQVRYDAEALF